MECWTDRIRLVRLLCYVVRHYRLRSCVLNSTVHPSIVGGIFERRLSGDWHLLDENSCSTILCDGESDRIAIGSDCLVEIDAVRIRMTSRNYAGTSQMHVNECKAIPFA
jgi:hypothetical protein